MAPGRAFPASPAFRPTRRRSWVGANPTTPAGLRALTAAPFLDEADELLGRGSVDAIGYASTSSRYAIGFDAEAALVARLSRRVGIPVAATCASAVLALRVLGVERIALVDPPWFDSVAVGAFVTGANVCVAFATTKGSAGIVAVLSALYPIVTVVLARLLLAERLSAARRVGGVTALAGAALVAAG
jgi:drug/metabolite transporter (DMT)-like permease